MTPRRFPVGPVRVLRAAAACMAMVAASAGAVQAQQEQAQKVEAGERAFFKCRACHQVGEGARNLVGPQLNGLFGRKAGTVEGYSYSAAAKASGLVWDDAGFAAFMRSPRAVIPGTKMVFAGLRSDAEIAGLIAFLRQFGEDGAKR